jgi:hypothetical protein
MSFSLFGSCTKIASQLHDTHTNTGANTQQIGSVIDETGTVDSGKLVLSVAAWEQLLGRTVEQLGATKLDTLRYLEHRLLLLRVTMGFVWCADGEIGRLGVWCIGN